MQVSQILQLFECSYFSHPQKIVQVGRLESGILGSNGDRRMDKKVTKRKEKHDNMYNIKKLR